VKYYRNLADIFKIFFGKENKFKLIKAEIKANWRRSI